MAENKKARSLYDALVKDGYKVGSYDSFMDNVQDEAKRKSLYDVVSKRYDVGDYDSFTTNLISTTDESPKMDAVPQVSDVQVPEVVENPAPFTMDAKVRDYVLANKPDMFKSRSGNYATAPFAPGTEPLNELGERLRIAEEMRPEMIKEQNKGALRTLGDDVAALRKDLTAKINAQKEETSGLPVFRSDVGAALLRQTKEPKYASKEALQLQNVEYAEKLLNKSQRLLEEGENPSTSFIQGLGRGVSDSLSDLDKWTMGWADLENTLRVKDIVRKIEQDQPLDASEQAVMDAMVTNAATEMLYRDSLGRGYKAGEVTGESLPFMLDMIVGMGSIQSATRPLSKAMMKYATTKLRDMGLRGGSLGMAAGRGVAHLGSGLKNVGIHTATFGAPRVAADYQERGLGQTEVGFDAAGNAMYQGQSGQESGLGAFGKSVISTAAETGSELLGEKFMPLLGFVGQATGLNRLAKIMPKQLGAFAKEIKANPGYKEAMKFAKAAHISDPISETMEEEVNNLVSVAIGDMSPQELRDMDMHIDTFLGVAPVSVLFGGIGAGGYIRNKYKVNKELKGFERMMQEEYGEDWTEIRNALQNSTIEEARGFVKDILMRGDLPKDRKAQMVQYVYANMQEQALSAMDGQMSPEEIEANKKEIWNAYQLAAKRIDFLSPEQKDALATMSIEEIEGLNVDEKTKQRMIDYKAAAADMHDYQFEMDARIQRAREQAIAQVEELTNFSTNTVMRVKSGYSENPIHIVRGNVTFNEDGTVDSSKSDKVIYYLDEQGAVKMGSINMIQELVDNTDAATLAEQAANDAQAEVQAQEVEETSPIDVEMTINTPDASYYIQSKNPDGSYIVNVTTPQGVQIDRMTEEQLQDLLTTQQAVQEEVAEAEQEANEVSVETAENAVAPQGEESSVSNGEANIVSEADFEASLPKDKNGQLDFNAFTPQQAYEYTARTMGEEAAREDLQADLNNMQSEVNKLSEQVKKASGGARLQARQKLAQAQEQLSSLQEFYNSVVPQQETQEEVQEEEVQLTEFEDRDTYDTLAEINSSLTPEEVDAFVANRQKSFEDEIKKLEKKAPKIGTDMNAYLEQKKAFEAQKEELQRKADYWKDIRAELDAMRSQVGEEESMSVLEDMQPQNAEELAALFLTGIKLNRDNYLKETGYGETDAKKMFGLFSKDGISIERAGELLEIMAREEGYNFFDEAGVNEGRNAILEVLSQVTTRGDLFKYIKRRREEKAKKEAEAAYSAYENDIQKNFNMTVPEYEQYVEVAEREIKDRLMSEEDYAEFMSIFADETLNEQKNGREETDNRGSETSGEVLSGEQLNIEGGNTEAEKSAEPTDGRGDNEGDTAQEDAVEQPTQETAQPTETQQAIQAAEAEVNTEKTETQPTPRKVKQIQKANSKDYITATEREQIKALIESGNKSGFVGNSYYEIVSVGEDGVYEVKRTYRTTDNTTMVKDENGKLVGKKKTVSSTIRIIPVFEGEQTDNIQPGESVLNYANRVAEREEKKEYYDALHTSEINWINHINGMLRRGENVLSWAKSELKKVDETLSAINESDKLKSDGVLRLQAETEGKKLALLNAIETIEGNVEQAKKGSELEVDGKKVEEDNIRFREDEQPIRRSIVDRDLNELSINLTGEDFSQYPYEDRRTNPDVEGDIWYGYSEPQYKGVNAMDSDEVPEPIKDILSDNEYEIDKADMVETLQNNIEFEGGYEEESAQPYVEALNWLSENGDNLVMSDKVNLIIDAPSDDVRFREDDKSLIGVHNISEDKLKKAMKQGGLANPSTAVIDVDTQDFEGYGEISLIMPSSLVDKKTGRNAGTYSGDAWTPVYPDVKVKIDDKGLQKGYNRVDETIKDDKVAEMLKSEMRNLSDNEGRMEFLFLSERGENPEVVYKKAEGLSLSDINEKYGISEGGTEQYAKFKELPEDKKLELGMLIVHRGNESKVEKIKQIMESDKKYEKAFKSNYMDIGFSQFDSFMYDLFKKERDKGQIDRYDTLRGAREKVRNEGLTEEYEKWKSELLEYMDAKEMIFNGYDRNGRAKYIENTLENVSKIMKKQGKTNTYGDKNLSATRAAFLKKFNSLAAIRKEKGRLSSGEVYTEEYNRLNDEYSSIVSELAEMQTLSDNPFFNTDYAAGRLQEAIDNGNPIQYLEEEYGYELSDGFKEELQSFLDSVSAMPSKYFETKFERPVYINEFASAVVPKTLSEDVKQYLSEQGLTLHEYDETVEGDRKRAMLEASQDEGIRFRFIGEQGAARLDAAEEATTRLDNLNVAREMEQAGKDAKAIKMATGWERGADGKWRYETADAKKIDLSGNVRWLKRHPEYARRRELNKKANSAAILGTEALTEAEQAELDELKRRLPDVSLNETQINPDRMKLADIVDDDTLFEAYPFLKDVAIKIKPLDRYVLGSAAIYRNNRRELVEPEIWLNKDEYEKPFHGDLKPSVIEHEIQHIIQALEGFAEGGTSSDVRKAKDKATARLRWTINDVKSDIELAFNDKRIAFNFWNDNIEDAIRYMDALPDKYMSLAQEFFFLENMNEEQLNTFDAWLMGKDLGEYIEEKKAILDRAVEEAKVPYGNVSDEEVYRRIAGEVEARNVQSRLEMTAEQRRNTLASETEDVAREDQIFLYDAMQADSRYITEDYKDVYVPEEYREYMDAPVKRDPAYDADTVFNYVYRMSPEYNRPMMEARKGILIPGTGEINIPAAQRLRDTARDILGRKKQALLDAMADASMAARRYLMSIVNDIDDALKFFDELAEGKDVWRWKDPYYRNLGMRAENNPEIKKRGFAKHAREVAGKFGVPVTVHHSLDSIPSGAAKNAIANGRKVKGWYDTKTQTIHIYMPNAASLEDVEATILHEGVAHYGLRQLVGEENFDDFLDEVFANVSDDVRKRILNNLAKYKYDARVATEEYMASLAEGGVDTSTWNRIKQAFKELLRKVGINVKITDNELKYILWRSAQNLRMSNPLDLAQDVAMQYQMGVGNYLREGTNFTGEEQSIINEAKKNGTYMKAPNGQPTNLTEKQWAQVRTQAFKDWFGDWENSPEDASKVVDENGEPKVVYHGTMNEFSAFEPKRGMYGTIYFSKDINVASHFSGVANIYVNMDKAKSELKDAKDIDDLKDFAKTYLDASSLELYKLNDGSIGYKLFYKDGSSSSGSLYKAGQSDRDVFDKDEVFTEADAINSLKELFEGYTEWRMNNTKDRGRNLAVFLDIKNPLLVDANNAPYSRVNFRGNTMLTDDIAVIAKSEGYDGTVLGNVKETDLENILTTDYIVFSPIQVKSATENTGSFDPTDPDIRFRDTDTSISDYNETFNKAGYWGREAWQDSMLSLKNLQDIVEEQSGNPIQDFENAYMAENQLSRLNKAQSFKFWDEYMKPLADELGRMVKGKIPYQDIADYMMLSHGIERNIEMTNRERVEAEYNKTAKTDKAQAEKDREDAYNKFYSDIKAFRKQYKGYDYLKALVDYFGEADDYSATEAILSRDGNAHTDFQTDALAKVKDFEDAHNVDNLRKLTKKASDEILRKSFESGMMSRDTYNRVKDMFAYYVPLRGWEGQTAEDVYDYMKDANPVNSALKKMKGRKTIPDDVFATIGNMGESAIVQGNRNAMKQKFYNMAVNHPTDLITLTKAWYVPNVNGDMELSLPQIDATDDAETIAQKIKDHDELMRNTAGATQKKQGLNIDYPITASSKMQHAVVVKIGGKDYVMYVNGNPRAAQAVNGLTNPDAETNPALRATYWLNRQLSALYTSRNPEFLLPNFSRDYIEAGTVISVKEDADYRKAFRKNARSAIVDVAKGMRGKLKGQVGAYYKEFTENGGEMGYMTLSDVNAYKKKLKKQMDEITGRRGSAKKALNYITDAVDAMNRYAETISRFATYRTSREMGRSIEQSIKDASDVTVNFSKKGSGFKSMTGKMIKDGKVSTFAPKFFGLTAGTIKMLKLFINPAIQSLANWGYLAKKAPKAVAGLATSFAVAGFVMPMVNEMLWYMFGDDDEECPYNDLPEWVRRNNLCIGFDYYLTLPLPHTLRAFYGIGEMAYQVSSGRKDMTAGEIIYDIISQLAALLPVNPLGNDGDIIKTLTPDSSRGAVEAYIWNEDFMGNPIAKVTPFNERDPEYKRVYKGTAGWLVDATKFLNDWSAGKEAGREFRKGTIDWNPAKIEHMGEAYLGGLWTFLNNTGKTIYYTGESLLEGELSDDLVLRNVPWVRRFVAKPDERNAFSSINEEYFDLVDEMEQFDYEVKGVKKSLPQDPEKYTWQYEELMNGEDMKRYKIYEGYKGVLDYLYQISKQLEGDERDEIEMQIMGLRRELVEELRE